MADVVTLAQVKDRLKIADTADDTYLGTLISSLTDWMEAYAGRWLTPHDGETHLFDTAYGSAIDIPQGIRTITSVQLASSSQPDTGGTYASALATSLLVIRPPEAERLPGLPGTRIVILSTTAACVDAVNGAKVVGNYGPATTPARFQGVALDAIATAWQARRAGATGGLGADASTYPWASYFGAGSPQRQVLREVRGVVAS